MMQDSLPVREIADSLVATQRAGGVQPLLPWFLLALSLCAIAMLLRDKSGKTNAAAVSDFIYKWPWIGTAMGVVLFLAIEMPLFHQGALVGFQSVNSKMLHEGMDQQYQFLVFLAGVVFGAFVGKRWTTKATVIDAQTRAAESNASAGGG